MDVHSVRGSTLTETAHPPGTIVTIRMSCFTTGGPGKEHGTNKPSPTWRVQERSKNDAACPATPRILLAGIRLGQTSVHHQEGL